MRKLQLVFVFVLFGGISLNAQTSGIEACPSVSITGPAGIVNPGEIGFFIADIKPKEISSKLNYFWTVSDGIIESGQGTHDLRVRFPYGKGVTATLKISGLPAACVDSWSEHALAIYRLLSIKVANVIGRNPKITKITLEQIKKSLGDEPNGQLYIIQYVRQNTSQYLATGSQDNVSKQLKKVGIDLERITYILATDEKERMTFWLSPPGTSPPTP